MMEIVYIMHYFLKVIKSDTCECFCPFPVLLPEVAIMVVFIPGEGKPCCLAQTKGRVNFPDHFKQ